MFMPLLLFQYSKFGSSGENNFQPSLSESGLVFLEMGISTAGFELQGQATPKVEKQNAKNVCYFAFSPPVFAGFLSHSAAGGKVLG